MSIIRVLSPHVADLIAAGEVVERPASVIKEMCENSVDAGARNITVEIKHGGLTYIRISDDGSGMSPEDAEIAFLRHATSKLRDESGLERIETLGFRGEALAAISAVSRLELRTRRKGTDEGVLMKLTAGEIDDMVPAGCPEGTTMTVRDLFYNTPARLKFLKSDKTEGAACHSAALKTAMANPGVSFRFIKDGEEVFFTPGNGDVKATLYALLGRDIAKDMLPCSSGEGDIKVSGFVCSPTACRGNRAGQYFFINGRPIKSLQAQNALEMAYKNRIMTGRFPSCALYITTDCGKVDVNVHPTKAEVRFSDEKALHSAVYYAALSALDSGKAMAPLIEKPAAEPAIRPKSKSDFFLTMSAEEYKARFMSSGNDAGKNKAGGANNNISYEPAIKKAGSTVTLSSGRPEYKVTEKENVPSAPKSEEKCGTESAAPSVSYAPLIKKPEDKKPESVPGEKAEEIIISPAAVKPIAPLQEEIRPQKETPLSAVASPEPVNISRIADTSFKYVGEALGTYIIAEKNDELIFIDKHAAHERLNFNKLVASKAPVMSQYLLIPETYSPGAENMELIEENLELLSFAGFEIDIFGENSVIIRSVPYDCEGSETALLEELCENIKNGGDDLRNEMLKTVACKAAIKAGKSSDRSELISLVGKVLSGEIAFCPHGRPVSFRIGKKELDKKIKRIV